MKQLDVLLRHRLRSISPQRGDRSRPSASVLNRVRVPVLLAAGLVDRLPRRVALRASIVRSLAAVAWTEVRVPEGRRRDREREGSRQQHRCDSSCAFLLSFSLPPRFFPARPGRRNQPLDPKKIQAREPVPNWPVPYIAYAVSAGDGEGPNRGGHAWETADWPTARAVKGCDEGHKMPQTKERPPSRKGTAPLRKQRNNGKRTIDSESNWTTGREGRVWLGISRPATTADPHDLNDSWSTPKARRLRGLPPVR